MQMSPPIRCTTGGETSARSVKTRPSQSGQSPPLPEIIQWAELPVNQLIRAGTSGGVTDLDNSCFGAASPGRKWETVLPSHYTCKRVAIARSTAH